MKAREIRQTFLEFFKEKGHKIVPSAPIVVKNDPTLMFTNAGMNPFKDYFLGNKKAVDTKVADSQKCLRVSGKHNDLEEVGIDSYHHTMFEMLGNWSFGDYFKGEAIAWAWELLTEKYKLDPDRLYVSVFGGDTNEGLGLDQEAEDLWTKYVDPARILPFGKGDNFWEMGETGPCGPCSEIHIDLRSDEERAAVPGSELVNQDHPLVIEIWNLVFIQFNRKANGSLEDLPDKHIDTGMGFERLCMAVQQKSSNYDTDVFMPFIEYLEKETGIQYTGSYDLSAKSDIAMRVIVDHVRAVSFTIADGELPSNTGAGYVIRRILRRAVRYYYSFLNVKEPLLHKLVEPMAQFFDDVFPELEAQHGFVTKVILEEEKSFLRTLSGGLKRIETLEVSNNIIDGNVAFELYDTYGFPIDLTRLIASEKGWTIDEDGFKSALNQQKERSRADAKTETGDWIVVADSNSLDFVGYDTLHVSQSKLLRHRTVIQKEKEVFQIVLDKTPFYAEGGGQVGDQGTLSFGDEIIKVLDTKKENDLTIHFVDRLPQNMELSAEAQVNATRRKDIENNHSGTHLLHAALRQTLGTHVQQKGSLVKDDYFRFDFSHFEKMTEEEILKVEEIVNQKIRENISLEEHRSIPINDAKDAGAMMLFGEKYGDNVRMITFDADFSRELCGGCHVKATGNLGVLKIFSESGIAAGVRRIEAYTAQGATDYIQQQLDQLNKVKSLFKNPVAPEKSIADLQEENKSLKKELEQLMVLKAASIKDDLIKQVETHDGINYLSAEISAMDSKLVKTLVYNIEKEIGSAVILLGMVANDKPQLILMISDDLVESKSWNAGNVIRNVAKEINGGGGGQASFATAGGSKAEGLANALKNYKTHLT